MSKFRASAILIAFLGLTLPLMPVQALLIRVSPRAARRFPHWYHRQVCRLIGIDISLDGAVASGRPVLLVSNHTSWLDIPVLSAVAPVSFVAKKEVGSWPLVSSLARLQRTVFVDRNRRHATGDAADEISERLKTGDVIVLFAEGTSSDGNRVLPFKTSLFGSVKPGARAESSLETDAVVQTVAIVYTHLHGVALGRADRPRVGWYGDMEMTSHAWELLGSGPLKATIAIGPPVPLSDYKDRKHLAIASEQEVRRNVHSVLRTGKPGAKIEPVEPSAEARKMRPSLHAESKNWT